MDKLQWAKYYVEKKGFSVIPVGTDKKPAIKEWKPYQTKRPTKDELQQWFGNGSKNNIGIVTGAISGIAVVDFDTPEAVKLAKEKHFPTTPMVKTARGYHAYCKHKPGVGNFQDRDDLAGIDLRAEGGFVVAPLSIHETGKKYEWVAGRSLDDLPLADLPEWILAVKPEDKTPLKDLYAGVSKGDRNQSLARLAGSWVNDGLTYDECLDNAVLWNQRNISPLPEKEIERTVRSIYEKHQRSKPKQEDQTKIVTSEELYLTLESWNYIRSLNIQVEWLVDRLIPKGAITILFGKGGIGKTWLSLDIARCVGDGSPFHGYIVTKTPVIFIDFENPLAVLNARTQKLGNCSNVFFWRANNEKLKAPKLDNQSWELYKSLPQGSLLIFDTLRASQGKDENASDDMGLVLGRLKELRDMGFTIILLHHTPRNSDKVPKGSTAIVDLADHVLGLTLVKKTKGGEEIVVEDKDDEANDDKAIYRFGVRDKTRFEPYHVYLTLNPDRGFELAPDPQEDTLEEMYKILNKSGTLTKTAFAECCKGIGMGINRLRKLIDLGQGRYWDIERRKDQKNAYLVTPKIQFYSFTPPIDSVKLTNCHDTPDYTPVKLDMSDAPQPRTSVESDSFTEGACKTEKLDLLEGEI